MGLVPLLFLKHLRISMLSRRDGWWQAFKILFCQLNLNPLWIEVKPLHHQTSESQPSWDDPLGDWGNPSSLIHVIMFLSSMDWILKATMWVYNISYQGDEKLEKSFLDLELCHRCTRFMRFMSSLPISNLDFSLNWGSQGFGHGSILNN